MQRNNDNFSEMDWKVYQSLLIQDDKFEPDHIIYLECSPENSLKRVEMRGNRSEKSGYTLKYMEDLNNIYIQYLWESISKR